MATPCRTDLRFHSYAELLADVEQLHANGWEKCGQWSLATMCDHIARWTAAMFDGGLPTIPRPFRWIARAVIGRMAKQQKYPGFKLHAPAGLKPAQDISELSAITEFRSAIARLQQMQGPTINTLPFGPLPADDFQQMALLHAAHHLSFLRPQKP